MAAPADSPDRRSGTAPERYSAVQIALHWIIAALVVAQFAVNDDMRAAFRDRLVEGEAAPGAGAWFHIASGLLILGLTLLRLAIRLWRGAPPPDEGIPPLLLHLAMLTHVALYGLLLLMPLTGAVAWFLGVRASGALHEIGRLLFLPLIGVHVLGALVEHFVMRNDTLMRMLRATER